jgi:hypothetical protein
VGVMYHLEQADNPAGPWSSVFQQEAMGDDADIIFTGPIDSSTGRKFFRVAATHSGL